MSRYTARSVVLALCIASLFATTQATHADTGAGLGVSGALAEITAEPGQTVVHDMVVTLGSAAVNSLDIDVEPRGLGESVDGALVPLAASDDSSPFSGRELIVALEPARFTLAPGGAQVVSATLALPAQLESGIRYADIYIHGSPLGEAASVGVVVGVNVPVLLSVANSTFSDAAAISNVTVDAADREHIVVTTLAKNLGDHHIRADNQVSVDGPDGARIGQATLGLNGPSLLPTAEHAYRVSIDAAPGQLAPGVSYAVDSKVVLADGRVLAERHVTFILAPPQIATSNGSARRGLAPTAVLPLLATVRPTSGVTPVPTAAAAEQPSTPVAMKSPPTSGEMPSTEQPTAAAPPPAAETGQEGAPSEESEPAPESPPASGPARSTTSGAPRSAGVSAQSVPATPTPPPPTPSPTSAPPTSSSLVRPTPIAPAAPAPSTPEVAGATAAAPLQPAQSDHGLFLSWPLLGGILAALISAALAFYALRR
jgi:hypothetical protein